MTDSRSPILQGTLDLMVLKTLEQLGAQHGYGIARCIEQVGERGADSAGALAGDDRADPERRPKPANMEFDEELAAHLAMAEADKIRDGMSPAEAGREARGLPFVSASWLDLKVALRMLRKSWGLTLIAGLAMMVVIAFATVVFDVITMFGATDLPLDEGERVVVVQTWDADARARRALLH